MKTINILTGAPNVVNTCPSVTAYSPGTVGPVYELPLNNVTGVTVSYADHRITKPRTVRVTDTHGRDILIDVQIDRLTGSVTITATKPFSGFLYIA